jgi:hypothetical protein
LSQFEGGEKDKTGYEVDRTEEFLLKKEGSDRDKQEEDKEQKEDDDITHSAASFKSNFSDEVEEQEKQENKIDEDTFSDSSYSDF